MTHTQYTSLEVSRLIASKVPEVRTTVQSWRQWSKGVETDPYIHITPDEEPLPIQSDNKDDGCATYLFRLDDVIKAIKVYGEKEGWTKKTFCPVCDNGIGRDCDERFCDVADYYCHRLLTAYLPSLSMQSPEVERVIRDVFE